jgi:hypothetical protein
MKVTKLTQTKVTLFRDGLPNNSWWFWIKHRHLKINIQHVEGLEVCRTQRLTPNSCNSFYTNNHYTSNTITIMIIYGTVMK